MRSESLTAIEVRRLTKVFRVHFERNNSLKDKLIYFGRAKYRDFVALKDINLSIISGTTTALIGINGSGKSTLLKILSRILYPTTGEVVIRGRVSSLLELGAGFHPDFTGYENIFLNAAIMGLSKREVRKRVDEIVEFSELGDFIHEPVRSYSSGMYMRLAFSVATIIEPDILLVDEVLAVGDAAFQEKCLTRLRTLQRHGTTIVMVTHDMKVVESFCDQAIWLHDSRVRMIGNPSECVAAYLNEVKERRPMSYERSYLGG
ncbi:MAG: ABC transporter ATP-binding protein [Alicyclobacillus sp.]|nr:ABC transporter ATP-binding protein [Alicyclobacillus sp.]